MDRPIIIRRASSDDLAQIVDLERRCFSTPWSEDSLAADLTGNERSVYLAAMSRDKLLVGYMAFWAVHDEGQVTNIAIDPGWRKQGIATALLQEVERIARIRKIGKILLEVRENNTAARRLYANQGFRQIGIRRAYYEKPVENAIIMLKEIEQ